MFHFLLKNRFYPAIMFVSFILLAATFGIYTKRSNKELLDHLTRIMRHYVFTMGIAFLVLSINQVFNLKETSSALCIITGNQLNMTVI